MRYISGNVLTGKHRFLITVIWELSQPVDLPEGRRSRKCWVGWRRVSRFQYQPFLFSWMMGKKKEYVLMHVKGGERHMIMSNEYDHVLAGDILPEYLIKAIIAGDIDQAEALGIYEVAPEDFALCEFVCSSKMELQRIVRLTDSTCSAVKCVNAN